MSRLKRFLRDPLLHFLLAGGLLFAAYQAIEGPRADTNDANTITVDRTKLLTFLQYQSVAFQPSYFEAQLNAMPEAQKRELIAKYVREEALYREAQAMGLTEGDYVIRRRMVEKILYLFDDAATESFAPTDAELQAYFQKHLSDYTVAPSLTFTHVFVDSAIKRTQGAERYAEQLKQELEAKHAGFNDAPAYGDRFPYLQNYVGRDPAFIEHQLGKDFAAAVMKLAPSEGIWYGPIKSQFGYHLVLITRHDQPFVPKLDDVKAAVKDDLLRDTISAYREKAIADLIKRFKVKVADLSPPRAKDLTADAARNTGAVQ